MQGASSGKTRNGHEELDVYEVGDSILRLRGWDGISFGWIHHLKEKERFPFSLGRTLSGESTITGYIGSQLIV
jgi:hypothetical protein